MKNLRQNEQHDLGNVKRLIQNYCTKEWQYLVDFYKSSEEYKIGEAIFCEGEQIKSIHIIETGKVKIFSSFDIEQERIIRLATDDHIIGHRGLGEDFTYSVSASSLTYVKLNLIPIDLFKNLLKANSEFCYFFMLFIAEELRRSERHIKNMENMALTQKVATALIMNVETFGYEKNDKGLLTYTLSRKDLSRVTGSTYESIVRALSAMNDANIIKTDGKKLRVLNEEKLREIANASNSKPS